MFRRPWVRAGLLAAAFLLAGGAWVIATRPRLPTEMACANVKAGMTAAEAEAILGTRKALCLSGQVDGLAYEGYVYPAESGTVQVSFTQGKVTEVRFRQGDHYTVGDPSLTDRLRAWLGW